MSIVLTALFLSSLFSSESSAQIFINIRDEGDNSTSASVANYHDIAKNLTSNITSIQSQLDTLNIRWEKELATQKKALQDLNNLVSKKADNPSEPMSCTEALRSGGKSGVRRLYLPNSDQQPFDVYCLADPNNGPAWTLVQRRQDGSVDFYRGWYDYKRGFGNLEGEFWIGLDKLHALTNSAEQELWIEMEDFEGEKKYARYASFAIGDESTSYVLNALGKFTGNGGDSFLSHRGQKFSTLDNDNDKWDKGNCARDYTGAWWYRRCHNSNLNGRYLHGKSNSKDENGKGVQWFTWHGHYSLKYAHMAIRPVL